MLEATVERNGKTTTARRFFLSSLALDPPTFARAVRAHWGIEANKASGGLVRMENKVRA